MAFAQSAGRPPLSSHIAASAENTIRKMYLAGATMAEIGAAVGQPADDVYRYAMPRMPRWKADDDFEAKAIARGHMVVWKNFSRATGGSKIRPITLPGVSILRQTEARP